MKTEINNIVKLAQDTLTYFQNLADMGARFDPMTFAMAVGHDALDVSLDIKGLLPEINEMSLEDAHALLLEILPIFFQAIELVKKK